MNKLNEDGLRYGPWETYYSNGDVDIRNQYLNGHLHGPCESYWENGRIHYKANWFMDNKIGFWEIFSNSGESWNKEFFL